MPAGAATWYPDYELFLTGLALPVDAANPQATGLIGVSAIKQLGLPPNVEIVLGELGLLALALGDIGLARARLEEALTIARSIGDRYGQSGFASNLSEVAHARGDNEAALALARQGLAIALADANTSLQAIALVAEGNALLGLGRLDEAEAGYRSAGAVYLIQRRALPGLSAQSGRVEVALKRGDPDAARGRAEEILSAFAADASTAAGAPAQVYWACWRALVASGDTRSSATLTQAQAVLRAQRDYSKRRCPRALRGAGQCDMGFERCVILNPGGGRSRTAPA